MPRIQALAFWLWAAVCATCTACFGIAPQHTYHNPQDWGFLRTPAAFTITTPAQVIGRYAWLWFNVDGGATPPLSAADLWTGAEGVCVSAPFSPWLQVTEVTVDDIDPRLWLGLQLTSDEQHLLTATVSAPNSMHVAGPSAALRRWLDAARHRIEPVVRSTLGLRPGVFRMFVGTEISPPLTLWSGLEALHSGGLVGWRWEELRAVSVYVPEPGTNRTPPRSQAAAWRRNKLPTRPCPVHAPLPLLAKES